jgi:flagellar export protein FliJ
MRKNMRKTQTLSKILKLKEERKKELELEVKEMTEKVDAEYSKLCAIEKEYSDTLDLFDRKNSETYISAYDITSIYNYLSHISNMMREQKKVCLKKRDELTSLNNTLIAAHKDKKMYEKLTDKANKKELKDKINLEQKETDYISLSRYCLKKHTN